MVPWLVTSRAADVVSGSVNLSDRGMEALPPMVTA